MTNKKILQVVGRYERVLRRMGIKPKRMDPGHTMKSLSRKQRLEHAYYLIGGIREYVKNPEKKGKVGRHLGSLQTILSFCGLITLEDMMNHNRPDQRKKSRRRVVMAAK